MPSMRPKEGKNLVSFSDLNQYYTFMFLQYLFLLLLVKCSSTLPHSCFSAIHNCPIVERYTDPSSKTMNISKVNMKHAMSKKMDRFITAMTQFAGLRMKVSGMYLPCTVCLPVVYFHFWDSHQMVFIVCLYYW